MLKTLTLRPGDKIIKYREQKGKLVWETEYSREIKKLKDSYGERCYCCYCGEPLSRLEMTADHFTPISRGGLTISENLGICCKSCNLEKGSMTATEYLKYRSSHPKAKRADNLTTPDFKELTYDRVANIKDISVPKGFKRTPPTANKVAKMKSYIKKWQQLDKAIEVFSRNDWTLTDGYARYFAASEMQMREVPIIFKYKL